MAVGELHPPLGMVWSEYTPNGEVLVWECTDPDCNGGSIPVTDFLSPPRDRHSVEAAMILDAKRCPKDHYLLIF